MNIYKHGRYLWTGPTVYRPYPRRLESLTICWFNYKGSMHLLLSYLKTLSAGPAGVELTTSRMTARCSTIEPSVRIVYWKTYVSVLIVYWKTCFWVCFSLSYDIILSYSVKNSMDRVSIKTWKDWEVGDVKKRGKLIKSIGEQIVIIYVWKITFSRPGERSLRREPS